jgi:hypothetical protein
VDFVGIAEIEPWTFEQHLGEAVFIPAGCPHQVRNLKVLVKNYVIFWSRSLKQLTDYQFFLDANYVNIFCMDGEHSVLMCSSVLKAL